MNWTGKYRDDVMGNAKAVWAGERELTSDRIVNWICDSTGVKIDRRMDFQRYE